MSDRFIRACVLIIAIFSAIFFTVGNTLDAIYGACMIISMLVYDMWELKMKD